MSLDSYDLTCIKIHFKLIVKIFILFILSKFPSNLYIEYGQAKPSTIIIFFIYINNSFS